MLAVLIIRHERQRQLIAHNNYVGVPVLTPSDTDGMDIRRKLHQPVIKTRRLGGIIRVGTYQ